MRSWILGLAAAAAAVVLSGGAAGAPASPSETEVVVTLKAPPLSAFGAIAGHRTYAGQLHASQDALARRIVASVPGSRIRWRYTHVLDGLAVVLPRGAIDLLGAVPGVAEVWPNFRYHGLRATGTPQQIGADKLWGPNLDTAGSGIKIGILDEGLDAKHPYLSPAGYSYPPGFPKGQRAYTTPKVIVARAFPPPGSKYTYARLPLDPTESFHGTHVAGIAAGNYPTAVGKSTISGVAPRAYIGNYKIYGTPTPTFGLDGNSAEIAAGIEAAVADGMDVINLSIGEPEVEPSRDLVDTAIDGAAAAGVVVVAAAGNDFDVNGYGSVGSPANARGAIAVAAVDGTNKMASFSSAGPTPVSLQFKPDVAAPGVGVLSSLSPGNRFGTLDGTSMASPAIAGAAALLKERHPTWTVGEIKSALVQTGDPARVGANEAPATREGGGVVDLPRADAPLIFAAPTALSFGIVKSGTTRSRTLALSDAGGGSGDWTVTVDVQLGSGQIGVPGTVTVPGSLAVSATAGGTAGDVTGFVVLTRGTDVRRIPFWFDVASTRVSGTLLRKPGVVKGTTEGAPARITSYRYPTSGDGTWAGPERAFRVRITGKPANFGAVTLSGNALPHVVIGGSADHLAGYAGQPTDLNPYRNSYGSAVPAAGAVLPAPGLYDIVFDTHTAAEAGPFTFRWWVNDVTPPHVRLVSTRGGIVVAATDAGSGVDPSSAIAKIDGKRAQVTFASGEFHVQATKGAHRLVFTVADYQETKNMEDVARILPNTTTFRARVVVR